MCSKLITDAWLSCTCRGVAELFCCEKDIDMNYQQMLTQLIDKNQKDGITPRLLLHSCCAPCSSYVLEYLSQYFQITVLFYNPNLYPPKEYDLRAKEQISIIQALNHTSLAEPHPSLDQDVYQELLKPVAHVLNSVPHHKIEYLVTEFQPDEYNQVIQGLEQEKEGGLRCEQCFRLRLCYAAQYAKSHGFDYFTTTLSISPMKNASLLYAIGKEMEEMYGVKYLPSDFKKKGGYLRSVELSKAHGLYRQDYCGCVYSYGERRQGEK